MEFKVYPYPAYEQCTPFIFNRNSNSFQRNVVHRRRYSILSVGLDNGKVKIEGGLKREIVGYRLPNRKNLIDYLVKLDSKSDLLEYINNTYVLPTFSLSREEAFIKVTIRQLISAKHAKRLISDFIKEFGTKKNNLFTFPTISRLNRLTLSELKNLGLGFKSERILNGIKEFHKVDQIKGIGSWSKQILLLENKKNYSYYPFEDMSGERIRKMFNIDLYELSKTNRILAGDIYLYSVSFLENN